MLFRAISGITISFGMNKVVRCLILRTPLSVISPKVRCVTCDRCKNDHCAIVHLSVMMQNDDDVFKVCHYNGNNWLCSQGLTPVGPVDQSEVISVVECRQI